MKRLIPILFSFVLTSICLFASSGCWNWNRAWILLGLNFIAGVANAAATWRDTALQEERRNAKAVKGWDKALVGIGVFLGPVLIWVVAGLDTRFGWTRALPRAVSAAGVVLAVIGAILVSWAMRANQFFSAVVRIQKERGHRVVDGGPYGIIRHPGYAGMSFYSLATPLILGSWWAMIPAIVATAANALRTGLEDRTLQAELDGYTDYASRVRYRWMPALW